jgi:sugar/nucleoside kinase (ribokinase family)
MNRNIVLEFLGDGRRMIFRDPARASASTRLYDIDGLATAGLILVAGSVDEEVVEEVRKLAERLGIPWCWNPATSHFRFFADVVRSSTQLRLIQLNDQETATYVGLPPMTPPAELLASVSGLVGGKAFVLTCGSGGSLGIGTRGQAELLSCPAPRLPPGTPVVGLGDKHFALAACSFHRSGNLLQALQWAAANLR